MSIRIALIEDDEPARKIIARWLSAVDDVCVVSEFGDAELAMEELPRKGVDVVLCDINLPGASGVECVQRLKPQMPSTQFVMLTVYEDSTHIFKALQAGATGYLLKQTTHDELLAAIKYVHAGGSPMSGYIARLVVQCFPRGPVADDSVDLSPREREVLRMLASGLLFKEIASALNISVRTVDTYIRRIYEKLHVRSRAQAVAKYANLPPFR